METAGFTTRLAKVLPLPSDGRGPGGTAIELSSRSQRVLVLVLVLVPVLVSASTYIVPAEGWIDTRIRLRFGVRRDCSVANAEPVYCQGLAPLLSAITSERNLG